MKVAIDISILEDRRWTGVERYLAGLVEGLAEVGAAFEVELFSREPIKLNHPLSPNMRVVTVGGGRLPTALFREVVLAPAARRRGCTILHSGVTAIPLLVRKLARIATLHELTWLHTADPTRNLAIHRARAAAASMAADRLIVNSHHTATDVSATYPRAASRVRVVYPGVEAKFRQMANDGEAASRFGALRKQHGIPEGPFFLFVGRIEPKKNVGLLIEALAQLQGAALVLVGRLVSDEAELERRIDASGVRGRVIRTGFLADADLVTLLNDATALVYPSQMEGFGFPPLEAMACGTPAIVSDRGAIPEVTGGAALVVPLESGALAQAMHRVLSDDALRERLIADGKTRAAQFTFRAAATTLLDVYRELL